MTPDGPTSDDAGPSDDAATSDDVTTELGLLLEQVGRGRPLPVDGAVSLLPGPAGAAVAAIVGLTAHHLVAADIDPDWLATQLAGAGIGGPLKPNFLTALGDQLDAHAGGQDVLLVCADRDDRPGPSQLDGPTIVDPAALDGRGHPRIDRAVRYRKDVKVATVTGGLVTIGRGLAGRWEISVEVEPSRRGAGVGRALAEYGRSLVPADALLWAQVHPANVASLRAFLAAGYAPVGAEVLFTREPADPTR